MILSSSNSSKFLGVAKYSTSLAGIGLGAFTVFNRFQGYIFPDHENQYFLNDMMLSGDSKIDTENSSNITWNTADNDNVNLETTKKRNSKRTISPSEIFQRIKDASFKIDLSCDSGTAWILDYQEKNLNRDRRNNWGFKYPTKWFIATNAHVVSNFVFDSNPYNQSLPILDNSKFRRDIYELHPSSKCRTSLLTRKSEMFLYREDDRNIYRNIYTRSRLNTWNNLYKLKSKIWYENNRKTNVYGTRIKNPKLFYSAVNYLGDRYDSRGRRITTPYYKDFVVLEIDFETPEIAQVMTADFYHKYPTSYRKSNWTWNYHLNSYSWSYGNWDDKRKKFLNFFSDELMQKYSNKELREKRYFMGGYPAHIHLRNRDRLFQKNEDYSKEYSKLSYWRINRPESRLNLKNKYGENIIGHVSIEEMDRNNRNITTFWNSQHLYNWGYNYLLDNVYNLRSGSSGSMVVDEEGNLLGLYRMHDGMGNNGFVEPIRSKGIYENKKIIVPEYDLINGSRFQKTSYRQQLEKYYPKMKTFLKSQNWK